MKDIFPSLTGEVNLITQVLLIILQKLSKEEYIISRSPDETMNFGEKLSRDLLSGSHIFALYGTLGAGKTLLTKGIARGLQVPDWYYVNSPTFTLINEYEGRLPLYHFDLYRLDNQDDLLEIGFEDYLQKPGVMVIEWPEKVGEMILSLDFIRITLAITGEEQREIITSYNKLSN
ncbi:MAG: tRNA (adenosine(37)-N6)-threonylcarbamoyltransferase complex ATPase subunit type 1 TsaE [Deltaproteobacteria bacterium]|nr:tRNA (adenosine(37)-N6)-threonylcarbamoyltransferase complex ATPase subunit type 1 TsaE [Candidatus Tharpellaceae bacterium]